MEKKPPQETPKKADPKVSKDELPERDLNKVTGGTGKAQPHFGDLTITKYIDKA